MTKILSFLLLFSWQGNAAERISVYVSSVANQVEVLLDRDNHEFYVLYPQIQSLSYQKFPSTHWQRLENNCRLLETLAEQVKIHQGTAIGTKYADQFRKMSRELVHPLPIEVSASVYATDVFQKEVSAAVAMVTAGAGWRLKNPLFMDRLQYQLNSKQNSLGFILNDNQPIMDSFQEAGQSIASGQGVIYFTQNDFICDWMDGRAEVVIYYHSQILPEVLQGSSFTEENAKTVYGFLQEQYQWAEKRLILDESTWIKAAIFGTYTLQALGQTMDGYKPQVESLYFRLHSNDQVKLLPLSYIDFDSIVQDFQFSRIQLLPFEGVNHVTLK